MPIGFICYMPMSRNGRVILSNLRVKSQAWSLVDSQVHYTGKLPVFLVSSYIECDAFSIYRTQGYIWIPAVSLLVQTLRYTEFSFISKAVDMYVDSREIGSAH